MEIRDAAQTTCFDDSFSYLYIGYHASFVNVDASILFWHRHVNPCCEFCERVPAYDGLCHAYM
ncbi:MAG: hypothetical protein VZQ78_07250, partial [Prevotella sp.]|nr:hypothetical protein [Prevotella sp.]